jgi:hypothetical protein
VREGEQARRTFDEDYATVARLGKAVPVGDQTPSLLYQLEKVADSEDVDFRSMKVRSSGGGTPPASSAAPASGSAAGSTPGNVGSTQAAAAVAPPGSAVGAAGFPTMPFTFKFEGDFFDVERLFSQIERFTSTVPSGKQVEVRGRLVTVDGFSLIESKLHGFPRVNASVAATAYVLPPGEDAAPAVDSASSASAPAGQTASTSSKPSPPTATAGGLTP